MHVCFSKNKISKIHANIIWRQRTWRICVILVQVSLQGWAQYCRQDLLRHRFLNAACTKARKVEITLVKAWDPWMNGHGKDAAGWRSGFGIRGRNCTQLCWMLKQLWTLIVTGRMFLISTWNSANFVRLKFSMASLGYSHSFTMPMGGRYLPDFLTYPKVSECIILHNLWGYVRPPIFKSNTNSWDVMADNSIIW